MNLTDIYKTYPDEESSAISSTEDISASAFLKGLSYVHVLIGTSFKHRIY